MAIWGELAYGSFCWMTSDPLVFHFYNMKLLPVQFTSQANTNAFGWEMLKTRQSNRRVILSFLTCKMGVTTVPLPALPGKGSWEVKIKFDSKGRK